MTGEPPSLALQITALLSVTVPPVRRHSAVAVCCARMLLHRAYAQVFGPAVAMRPVVKLQACALHAECFPARLPGGGLSLCTARVQLAHGSDMHTKSEHPSGTITIAKEALAGSASARHSYSETRKVTSPEGSCGCAEGTMLCSSRLWPGLGSWPSPTPLASMCSRPWCAFARHHLTHGETFAQCYLTLSLTCTEPPPNTRHGGALAPACCLHLPKPAVY